MPLDAVALPRELAEYVRRVSVKESDVQRRLREETLARPDNSMLTSPEQAQLLALLVRMLDARRCLEIGVYTGYTSLMIAQAMRAGGRLVACDVSDTITATARRYWREAGVDAEIDLRIAPALETLDALLADGQADSFDFAYIDADKRTYRDYYERCLALLRRGGIVAADNVLRRGDVADPAVDDADVRALRAFNERLRDDERVVVCLLPMRDGLTLAWKKP
jgi:caffeoyl-CoA O-methyltransferase